MGSSKCNPGVNGIRCEHRSYRIIKGQVSGSQHLFKSPGQIPGGQWSADDKDSPETFLQVFDFAHLTAIQLNERVFRQFFADVSQKGFWSTTKAYPDGSAWRPATSRTSESWRRSSSLSGPCAFSSSRLLKKLLQTSSAQWDVRCASDICLGRISKRCSRIPISASCHEASEPASPAPMTGAKVSYFIKNAVGSYCLISPTEFR